MWKVGKLTGDLFKTEKRQITEKNPDGKWSLAEAKNELAKKDECFGFTCEGTREGWEAIKEGEDGFYKTVTFISGSTSIGESTDGAAWCSYGACNRRDRIFVMFGSTDICYAWTFATVDEYEKIFRQAGKKLGEKALKNTWEQVSAQHAALCYGRSLSSCS